MLSSTGSVYLLDMSSLLEDLQRIGDGELGNATKTGIKIACSFVHAVMAQHISKEEAVKFSLFKDSSEVGPILDIGILRNLVTGMPPET